MSRTGTLVALAAKPGGTALNLCAPAVGILRDVPGSGRLLGSGDTFATLTILGQTHSLLVPEGISGVVRNVEVDGSGRDALPVEYGQPIVALAPIDSLEGEETAADATPGTGLDESVPEGCHAVLCPADGVFYRRPRPTDDPYVASGSTVHTGQTLGLIEAMKTFSPIPYGGAGLPAEATVVEIRAEDAQEVRHGQVLFVVR